MATRTRTKCKRAVPDSSGGVDNGGSPSAPEKRARTEAHSPPRKPHASPSSTPLPRFGREKLEITTNRKTDEFTTIVEWKAPEPFNGPRITAEVDAFHHPFPVPWSTRPSDGTYEVLRDADIIRYTTVGPGKDYEGFREWSESKKPVTFDNGDPFYILHNASSTRINHVLWDKNLWKHAECGSFDVWVMGKEGDFRIKYLHGIIPSEGEHELTFELPHPTSATHPHQQIRPVNISDYGWIVDAIQSMNIIKIVRAYLERHRPESAFPRGDVVICDASPKTPPYNLIRQKCLDVMGKYALLRA